MTRVHHIERIEGVDLRLRTFFEEWARKGPFHLVIDPRGGIRDNAMQACLFAVGSSKARTALETPHGRGGAVDAWPARALDGGRVVGIYLPSAGPSAMELLRQYGELAEASGLRWGGRWLDAFPPTKANPMGGDVAHVEVPGWRELPHPPKARS